MHLFPSLCTIALVISCATGRSIIERETRLDAHVDELAELGEVVANSTSKDNIETNSTVNTEAKKTSAVEKATAGEASTASLEWTNTKWPIGYTCAGRCGLEGSGKGISNCWCDSTCLQNGDCCNDYLRQCKFWNITANISSLRKLVSEFLF